MQMSGEGGKTSGAPPSYDAPPAYDDLPPSYDDVAPSAYNPAYSQPQAPPVSAPIPTVSPAAAPAAPVAPVSSGALYMTPGQAVPAQTIPVQVVPMGAAPGQAQTQVVYVIQNQGPTTSTQATAQVTGQVTRPAQITTTGGEGQPGQAGRPAQVVVVQRPRVNDDPCCLYVFAVIGFLIPLVGFIGMCVYGCGQNLPPRQAQAFRTMCITTVIGLIINIVFYV